MKRFTFENATKISFGEGCVEEDLAAFLKPYHRILLTYGQSSIKRNGIYDRVIRILRNEQKRVLEFSGITPNPTYQTALKGAEAARSLQADLILAVGGGSVIDCSKCIAMSARYEGNVWNDFWMKQGNLDFEPIPIGVILTIPASGSEVNGGAVITNEEDWIKTDRDYPKMNPKFTLMDPTFTYSLSGYQMTCGAFDILSHLMEIYFSNPIGESLSDDLLETLMKSVIRDLRTALKNPLDAAARSNLMWAGSLAENRLLKMGKTLDFECHQMEHQLSAFTDCNHGAGLAVLHPVYYRHLLPDGEKQFARFARKVWEIQETDDSRAAFLGIEALAQFIREIGLPASFRELGIPESTDYAVIASSCNRLDGGFRQLTTAEILQIFRECR